ncbi:MAG: NmrA family NAD(P)-binding protein [Oceanicaulis sp.]
MSHDILVTGATGKTGGALARRLKAAGLNAAGMTSRKDAAGAGDPVPLVYGDLRRPETLPDAFKGVKALYLVTPLGPDEPQVGLGAIEAAEQAGVEKIVHLSIMNLEAMREIPHFETKIPIKERLLKRGPHVVLGANFFMQNDLMALPAILHGGVYPLPVGGAGVWSIDVEDIALAAFNALTSDDFDGSAVPLAGPQCVTGPRIAEVWSEALGRPVIYPGDAIDPFIEALKANIALDAWAEDDFRTMMAVTQRDGCPASEADRAATRAVLGRSPTPYADFAARTLAQTPTPDPQQG